MHYLCCAVCYQPTEGKHFLSYITLQSKWEKQPIINSFIRQQFQFQRQSPSVSKNLSSPLASSCPLHGCQKSCSPGQNLWLCRARFDLLWSSSVSLFTQTCLNTASDTFQSLRQGHTSLYSYSETESWPSGFSSVWTQPPLSSLARFAWLLEFYSYDPDSWPWGLWCLEEMKEIKSIERQDSASHLPKSAKDILPKLLSPLTKIF